jgi:hypothetical protein
MRTLLFTFFTLLLLFTSSAQKWVQVEIDPDSKMEIHGTTNVNSFACIQEEQLNDGALNIQVVPDKQKWNLNNANLGVALIKFDCGIQQMTRDFRSTLRSEDFPFLELTINSILPVKEEKEFLANVTIDLAGEQNTYLIPIEVNKENGKLHCIGERIIDFEDFNIDPPVKFLGMVKVHDQIQIKFNLILKTSGASLSSSKAW